MKQISQGVAGFKPESNRLTPRMSAYGKGERKFFDALPAGRWPSVNRVARYFQTVSTKAIETRDSSAWALQRIFRQPRRNNAIERARRFNQHNRNPN